MPATIGAPGTCPPGRHPRPPCPPPALHRPDHRPSRPSRPQRPLSRRPRLSTASSRLSPSPTTRGSECRGWWSASGSQCIALRARWRRARGRGRAAAASSSRPRPSLTTIPTTHHPPLRRYVVLFFYPLDFTFVCPTEIVSAELQLCSLELSVNEEDSQPTTQSLTDRSRNEHRRSPSPTARPSSARSARSSSAARSTPSSRTSRGSRRPAPRAGWAASATRSSRT
jgi:hypothetical protein